MANEQTNGVDPQSAPAPTVKPKSKPKLGTQGRKPTHRSTKLELNRETLTAQVITALVSGKTFKEISAEFGISEEWINRVKKKLPQEFIEYFVSAKTNEISNLIEQGLRDQLEGMSNLVAVTRKEHWVEAQRAPEIATLFGVLSDKTIRILAAIERANERDRIEREVLQSTREVAQGGSAVRRDPQEAIIGS